MCVRESVYVCGRGICMCVCDSVCVCVRENVCM